MGTMTIEQLRERARGPVITADEADYDEARKVYNAMIDRRPLAVVRCANAGDVMATVDFARENGVGIAVRGGSHSVPGFGVVRRRRGRRPVRDAGRLAWIPAARTARAEGGATWGDFNAATYPFGLATTGGIISTTGVGGLTLGGGIGYLDRGLGLSCDNLISADVVTADGQLVIASETAKRGPVLGVARGRRQLRRRHLVRVPAQSGQGHLRRPDVLRVRSRRRRAPVLPGIHRRRSRAARRVPGLPDRPAVAVHPGRPARRTVRRVRRLLGRPIRRRREGHVKPIRDIAPIVAEMVGPMPYPCSIAHSTGWFRPACSTTGRPTSTTELTDDAIEAHLRYGPKVPAVNSTVHIYPINGACHRVAGGCDGIRLSRRDFRDRHCRNVARSGRQRGQHPSGSRTTTRPPHHTPKRAATSTSWPKTTRTGSRTNYRGNYGRLVDVKRKYDPD